MIAGLAAALPAVAVAAGKPVLTVYTYDSFVAEWGPGPAVEKAFEATCGCDLRFVTAGDGGGAARRVLLEGARHQGRRGPRPRHQPDRRRHRQPVSLPPHGRRACPARSAGRIGHDPVFVPFDWGYLAFVYDRTEARRRRPTASMSSPRRIVKIVIQDPRSSTPGLGLLLWVKAAYGDRAPAKSGRGLPTTSSPSPRAGPKPTACSCRARRTWSCPTPPRPPIT